MTDNVIPIRPEELASMHIFSDGRVTIKWNDLAFETPEQINWLFSCIADGTVAFKEALK